jgi:hypothetical protein
MNDLDWRFTYHPPNAAKVRVHEDIRQVLLRAAQDLKALVLVDSYEMTLAIQKLEESMFWANAAVARYPRG